MNAQEMWDRYSARNSCNAEFNAWSFGDDPDTLAELVLRGIKTGTASLHLWYEMEDEALPQEGEYNIILDSREDAVCITRTTRVYIVPFDQVSKEHAYQEGEGDRSLAYWQKVHQDFFSAELKEAGMTFDKKMKVVCEEFVRVFP